MSDFSDSDCDTPKIDEDFNYAANYVQEVHNKLLPNDLLDLYALYKQATTGFCNTSKPGIFSVQARAKWHAWNNLGSMTQINAKRLYIEKLSTLDPNWVVAQKSQPKWVVHSMFMRPIEEIEISNQQNETVFDFVKDKNLSKLKEYLGNSKQMLDTLDETGLGLIHWASDRNAVEILEYLLSSGANVNLQDSEGQTSLHYAAYCGHIDCVRILLKFGADKNVMDNEGQLCFEVTDDENVRRLLEIIII